MPLAFHLLLRLAYRPAEAVVYLLIHTFAVIEEMSPLPCFTHEFTKSERAGDALTGGADVTAEAVVYLLMHTVFVLVPDEVRNIIDRRM